MKNQRLCNHARSFLLQVPGTSKISTWDYKLSFLQIDFKINMKRRRSSSSYFWYKYSIVQTSRRKEVFVFIHQEGRSNKNVRIVSSNHLLISWDAWRQMIISVMEMGIAIYDTPSFLQTVLLEDNLRAAESSASVLGCYCYLFVQ